MIKKIYIDLSKIITPHELFQEFSHIFSFPSYFGNNWDALFDMMNSLDPGSDIFGDMPQILTGIHLIFSGFDHLEGAFSDTDLNRFRAILVDLSASTDFRSDHLYFTFEIRYSQ